MLCLTLCFVTQFGWLGAKSPEKAFHKMSHRPPEISAMGISRRKLDRTSITLFSDTFRLTISTNDRLPSEKTESQLQSKTATSTSVTFWIGSCLPPKSLEPYLAINVFLTKPSGMASEKLGSMPFDLHKAKYFPYTTSKQCVKLHSIVAWIWWRQFPWRFVISFTMLAHLKKGKRRLRAKCFWLNTSAQ